MAENDNAIRALLYQADLYKTLYPRVHPELFLTAARGVGRGISSVAQGIKENRQRAVDEQDMETIRTTVEEGGDARDVLSLKLKSRNAQALQLKWAEALQNLRESEQRMGQERVRSKVDVLRESRRGEEADRDYGLDKARFKLDLFKESRKVGEEDEVTRSPEYKEARDFVEASSPGLSGDAKAAEISRVMRDRRDFYEKTTQDRIRDENERRMSMLEKSNEDLRRMLTVERERQEGRVGLEGVKQEGREGMEGIKQEGRKELAQVNYENRLKLMKESEEQRLRDPIAWLKLKVQAGGDLFLDEATKAEVMRRADEVLKSGDKAQAGVLAEQVSNAEEWSTYQALGGIEGVKKVYEAWKADPENEELKKRAELMRSLYIKFKGVK